MKLVLQFKASPSYGWPIMNLTGSFLNVAISYLPSDFIFPVLLPPYTKACPWTGWTGVVDEDKKADWWKHAQVHSWHLAFVSNFPLVALTAGLPDRPGTMLKQRQTNSRVVCSSFALTHLCRRSPKTSRRKSNATGLCWHTLTPSTFGTKGSKN